MADRIVMVGALNADLAIRVERLPHPGETVAGRDPEVLPGGKASNQAVAAARLGANVRLLGAVGDDENGRMLRDSTAAAGVDVAFVGTLPGVVTGQAIIPVDDAGENSIILVPGANGALSPDDIPVEAYADAAAVCLSLEVPLPVLERAAAAGRAAGATVILNPSPFRELPAAFLGDVDVLIVNDVEAAQLLGRRPDPGARVDIEALRKAAAWNGIRRVVVTRGAAGSTVIDGREIVELAARVVDAVDTTGAGDAFTGALAVGLAAGASLVDAAREASLVAALSVTRRGAQPSYPSRAELAAFR
jgi:ribokinase